MIKTRSEITAQRWFPLVALLALLIVFECCLRIFDVPAYLVPLPSQVLMAIGHGALIIIKHLSYTLAEALLGFIIGNLFAIAFGVIFSVCRIVRNSLFPLIVGLQAIPIVAIAPYIQIWFGPGLLGKVFLAALVCYFPATVISTTGFSRANKDASILLEAMGANRWQTLKYLRIPGAVPSILSALKISASLCMIGAIVAELAGAAQGIGYLILRASYEFRSADLFGYVSITTLVCYLLFKGVELLGNIYAKKYSFSYSSSDR